MSQSQLPSKVVSANGLTTDLQRTCNGPTSNRQRFLYFLDFNRLSVFLQQRYEKEKSHANVLHFFLRNKYIPFAIIYIILTKYIYIEEWIMADDEFAPNRICYANIISENGLVTNNR